MGLTCSPSPSPSGDAHHLQGIASSMRQAADTAAMIDILANAEPTRVAEGSLADVLAALGYGGQKVATALNGVFVPERARRRSL